MRVSSDGNTTRTRTRNALNRILVYTTRKEAGEELVENADARVMRCPLTRDQRDGRHWTEDIRYPQPTQHKLATTTRNER